VIYSHSDLLKGLAASFLNITFCGHVFKSQLPLRAPGRVYLKLHFKPEERFITT